MNYRTCGKCKGEFFAEFQKCPHCGQEYRENNRRLFAIVAGVAVLLFAVIAWQVISVNKKPEEIAEEELIPKEMKASLEERMSALPDQKQLEKEKGLIEGRIKELNKKLLVARQLQKKTLNLDGVMGHMSGEKTPEQDAAVTEAIISEMPEAKELKVEEAKLDAVIAQLAEISRLNMEKSESDERMVRFKEARRLYAGNLDASYDDLASMRNSLVSFKTAEPQYEDAQRLLAYVNEKIAAKEKKAKRKNQAVENERFEALTASLNEEGKRLKKEHPGWSVDECDLISKGKFRTGMMEEQVGMVLGKPYQIKTTRESGISRTKWLMNEKGSSWVYFEDGICVAFQK